MNCLKKAITFIAQQSQRKRFNFIFIQGEIYMSNYDELETIFNEVIEEVEKETLENFRQETLQTVVERFIERLDYEGINLSKAMKNKVEQTYNIEL